MNTTIYFVRHAQSHPSVNIPHDEWPLSQVGAMQAIQIATILENLSIHKIYSSPYLRCVHTVRPFVEKTGTEFETHYDLRERLIAGKLIDQFEAVWNQGWQDFDYVLPGCESSRMAQSRFVSAIRRIASNHIGKSIGISSHGNVIGLFLNHLDPSHQKNETEALRNPDILKIDFDGTVFNWDKSFALKDLDRFATDQKETPKILK